MNLWDLLTGGCSHSRTSFPLTIRRPLPNGAGTVSGTVGCYVVCLDCGREFTYDWELMKIIDVRDIAHPRKAMSNIFDTRSKPST